jgi:hypothetical protein
MRLCELQVKYEPGGDATCIDGNHSLHCGTSYLSLLMHAQHAKGLCGGPHAHAGRESLCRSCQLHCDLPPGICPSWRGRWHLPVTGTGLLGTQDEPWPSRSTA